MDNEKKHNYTNKEIEEYNEKRNKIIELKAKKEAEYQMNLKEKEKLIEALNKVLKDDGIKKDGKQVVITEENFDEMYKWLNDKKNKDIEEGYKIIEEMNGELKELC